MERKRLGSKAMGDRSIPHRTASTVAKGPDKKLHRFPRPTVAVDTALLTVDPTLGLAVLELARDDIEAGTWALPGTFVHQGETLADAVKRSLCDKIGVRGVTPIQLHVFDDPDRDHRDWVISVAHVAVVRPERLTARGSGLAGDVRLAPVDRPGELLWDHNVIVEYAKNHVRELYAEKPDPARLLATEFTMRELQRVHEAVLGDRLMRDAFRRAMKSHLIGTDVRDPTGSRGRPAELFRRAPARGDR